MAVSMVSYLGWVDAILACLRRETTHEAVATQFGVSVSDVQRWEREFVAAGSDALNARETDARNGFTTPPVDIAIVDSIARSFMSLRDPDEIYLVALEALQRFFGHAPTIAVLENAELVSKGAYTLSGQRLLPERSRLPLTTEHSVMVAAARSKRTLNESEISPEAHLALEQEIGPVTAELAVPIFSKGAVIGVLAARSGMEGAFGAQDQAILEVVASHLAFRLENALLARQMQHRLDQLGLVESVARKAVEDIDVQSVLNYTVETTCERMGYSAAAVALVNADGAQLSLTAAYATPAAGPALQVARVSIDEHSIIGAALKHGKPMFVNNVSEHEGGVIVPLLSSSRSALSVPIRVNGVPIGVFTVESEHTHAFDEADARAMSILSDQLTIVFRGSGLFQQTQSQQREINLFRRLADEAIVGILTRDAEGQIDYANRAAAGLFGFPDVASMRGVKMPDLYRDEMWRDIDQELCAQVNYAGGWVGEIPYQRRDGRTLIADVTLFPMHDSDGMFITYGTIIQDATERRRLLDTIQQTNSRLEAVLDATTDAVVVWDDTWRVLSVNPAAERLLGVRSDQLIGSSRAEWMGTPRLAAVVNAPQGERLELRSGERHVARCRNLRWYSERGWGHLTVIYDETSQVALEEAREDMVSMIVHDLRSPLSSLVGGVEMARVVLTEDKDLAKAQHFVGLIRKGIVRVMDIANLLLDVNKFESGQMIPERDELDVNTIFGDVVDQMSSSAQLVGITLSTRIENDLPKLYADSNLLRRALINLIDNAIKFTPDGGQVTLRAERTSENAIQFSVEDTGPGIPDDFRDRIFEKYQQISTQPGRRRGSGLGLAFCRLVAQAHGGRIWVESRPGGGSTFAFTINSLPPAPATSVADASKYKDELKTLGGPERGDVPAKIYQFTPNARQVMAGAHEKAEQFRHSQISTGHLLLGFFLATDSTARRILLDRGLDAARVEHQLKLVLGPQERAPGDPLTLSPAVKRTLELAVEEAHLLGEDHIGTEHLLLGLLRQDDDSAREILARLGVSPESIRTHTREALARSAAWVGYAGSWFDDLTAAKQVARNLRQNPVGTEHLLIALVGEHPNRHSYLLRGVDPDKILDLVRELPTSQLAPKQKADLSDELLRALGLAVEEGSRSQSPTLTAEHLLLGLLRQPESRAIDILKQLGIAPPDLERLVRDRLKLDQRWSNGWVR